MLSWTVHLKGPRRFLHAAVAVGHKVYSFGGHCYGENDTKTIDVHVFNTVSLRWTELPPPSAAASATRRERERPLEVPMRMCHTAVLLEDTIYIWGGIVNTEIEEVDNGLTIYGDKCNVLYAFDVDSHRWFNPRVSGAVPEARCGHSACVLDRNMYVFGGFNLLKGYTNDIYKLSTDTMLWSLISTQGKPAPPSEWHSATVIGSKMYVFGGRGGDGHYNDIRAFNTQTNCWLSTPSDARLLPEGRRGQSAFAHNGELYIFGGNNFSDLWKFNPESSWRQVEPRGGGPEHMSWMCCCVVPGDRVVLFGGRQTPGDLYILDLSPSLKTLCKLAVMEYALEHAGLPHDIRWELAAMATANGTRKPLPQIPPPPPEDGGREGLVSPGGVKDDTDRPRAHHH